MALPQRKTLRLQEYDYSTAGGYFVTICTYQKSCCFSTISSTNDDSTVGAHLCVRPSDPALMVEHWLQELCKKYKNTSLDSYVIMPDHIHFILFVSGAHTGAPLPEMIRWFKTQTTNAYIRGVKNGEFSPYEKHLWQRGYYEHVLRNEQDLFETRQYIQNNPLKAQLQKEEQVK